MSKISRSLSWNTRRKQKKDFVESAADHGQDSTAEALKGREATALGLDALAPASINDAGLRVDGAPASDHGTEMTNPTPRTMEVDSADLIEQDLDGGGEAKSRKPVRTWSFSRRSRRTEKTTAIEEAAAPDGSTKVYFLDGSCKLFEVTVVTTVGQLLGEVKSRLGLAATNAFALYQVQRGTHYLLHESALISEIKSSTDSRAKALGVKERRPKLLFKKYLFTKQDERLVTEKAFIHLFFIQAVSDVQRGNYPCKASDAVKLAAIHYYVWHGPYDPNREQFSISYMRELRLGEQLMPTPLVTAQVNLDWEARIQKEQMKISDIFSKLSGGRGISSSEAKVMYIKKVRKLPMYGTTLFHVHNSKIFAAGHFLIAANSSGIQFLHPITKEELHSAFFFSDLQRWEYTPKVFCFWSTKCDFLEDAAQGRHIVKYSLSTKQGWEISTTLHSYYKVLMQTEVSIHTTDGAPPGPTLPKGRGKHIAYEAESDSGEEGDANQPMSKGAEHVASVTTFTPKTLSPAAVTPRSRQEIMPGEAPAPVATGTAQARTAANASVAAEHSIGDPGPETNLRSVPAGTEAGSKLSSGDDHMVGDATPSPGGTSTLAAMLAAMANGEGVQPAMKVSNGRDTS